MFMVIVFCNTTGESDGLHCLINMHGYADYLEHMVIMMLFAISERI